MEPQTPQPEFKQNYPDGKKKRLTRLQKIIIIVCGGLIVLAVVIKLVMSHSSGGSQSADQLDPSIYHAREGYSAMELGAAIGDPLALDMSKHSAPLMTAQGSASSQSDNPIVYACNILSIKELYEQKAYLQARADTKAVVRGFLDRTGKAGVDPNLYDLPGSVRTDDSNACQYDLKSGDILNIAVYQPPYTHKEAIAGAIANRYNKTGAIAGLTTYKDKDESGSHGYLMVTGEKAIEFLFNGTHTSADMQKKLLTIAAKNFADQEKHGVGPAIPQFNTPTYTQKYARACDYISNDDIKNLTGSDASVYTTESLPSGTGVAKVGGKLYNSISTECARYNTGLGTGLTAGPFNQKLDITITSFNADAPAKEYMVKSRKNAGQVATIGDEGYGYRDDAGDNALVFRQGRFIVEVLFDATVQKSAGLQDTAAMTQKLTPYSQQLAAKLTAIR